jgi:hypothetical protein
MQRKISIEYDSDSDSEFEDFYRNVLKKASKQSRKITNIIDVDINNIRSFRDRESLFNEDLQLVEVKPPKNKNSCVVM